ncbi:MAG: hypothetical protein A2075_20000 [Geobacteraceae bacterium GWC2_58_44]|nr:MAG: hypothetical protein A2075_20000 [Geobacteraceae bacterium GWC2_58_44]HBG08344.1 DUF3108 domain-containing protein [Geobacter sp.]
MKKLAQLALCASLLLPLTLSASLASAVNVPERLVYDVSWTGVKSATTVHEVTAHGEEFHMVSTTRSLPWMATFFPVDDRTESVLTRGSGERFGTPKFYRQNINEGKYRALREAHFDPVRLSVETKDLLKKTEKREAISPVTYDSLSCIYFIRSLDLVPGKSIHIDIYDAKRLWKAEIKVLRREEISTPIGRFKTLVVQPRLKSSEGKSPRAGEMTVWISDDSLRIPVMMTSKAKLGKITATLVGGSYWP